MTAMKCVRNTRGKLGFIGTIETAGEEEAKVRVFPQFRRGLKGIEDFSHMIVLYWIHLRDNEDDRHVLQVVPRKHAANVKVGVFACRSPSRPNPIGLCVVELMKVEGDLLTVKGLDALQDSPIVDIKPYLPKADSVPAARIPEWACYGPST